MSSRIEHVASANLQSKLAGYPPTAQSPAAKALPQIHPRGLRFLIGSPATWASAAAVAWSAWLLHDWPTSGPLPPPAPAATSSVAEQTITPSSSALTPEPVSTAKEAPPPKKSPSTVDGLEHRKLRPNPIPRTESPVNEPPTLREIETALQSGRYEEAEDALEKLLAQSPYRSDALLLRATIASHCNNNQESASQWRQRAAIANPDDPAVRASQLGELAATDPLLAESQLKSLVEQHPKATAPAFYLGNLLAAQERWHEARQAYMRAVSIDAYHPDYLFNLAVSLDRLHETKQAALIYQRALIAADSSPATFPRMQAKERLARLNTNAGMKD